ncbi:Uncharacterised conserved protein [Echinococcus multilocularis]|uniref:Uncharacterized conserved protein n=1 Tax=Echinococcus multilocularis TaxID=6211 RepID=A0A068XZE7_ECHMU|nr:Uncharacterised conserved protein [Echinococcus multilocularis]
MSSEDADTFTQKMCAKIYNTSVDAVVSLVNEPSVALFRIQEHIRKTAPEIAEERKKAFVCAEKLQGVYFDLENSLSAISAFPKVESNLNTFLKTLDACNLRRQHILANQQNKKQDDFELGVDVVALLASDL